MTDERQQIERYLRNGHVELRCFDTKSEMAKKSEHGKVIWASWFNDYDCLRKSILFAESRGFDIYQTINPATLPATNAPIKPFVRTTKDDNIELVRTLFFDFDPVREVGTSASDDQIAECESVATTMSEYLDLEYGWGIPTLGYSGNGVHLYYNTMLTVAEASEYLRGLYAGLGKRFNTETVVFDVSVKNPSRIARCLGSTNHKAGRRSSVIYADDFVAPRDVIKTAKAITPPKPKRHHVKPSSHQEKRGMYIKNWDVVGAFTRRGMYIDQTQESGKHFVECPWMHEHTETGATDTVIWEGEWPQWHCSHAHCEGRDISDVIALFEVSD